MKKRFQIFPVVLTAIVFALISIFAGCSGDSGDGGSSSSPTASPTGIGTVTGRVTDEGGSPIKGATVTIQLPQKGQKSVSTDDKGAFIIEDLATGIQYYLVISAQGRVTIRPVFVIDENDPDIAFEVIMPQGSGTAEFTLPRAVEISSVTMKPGNWVYGYYPSVKDTPYPYDDETTFDMDVELKWVNKADKSFDFEKFIVFRSTDPAVDSSNGTAVGEIEDEFTLSYTDELPANGFGKYYYRVYKSYLADDLGVRVMVGSNVKEAYWDKYTYSEDWELGGGLIPTVKTTGSPSPTPSQGLVNMAVHEGKNGVDAIYAVDCNYNYLHQIDPVNDVIVSWSEFTEGDSFNSPRAVGTDESGKVYVIDYDITKGLTSRGTYHYRIVVLNPDRTYVTQYNELDFGGNVFDMTVGPGENPVIYVAAGPYIYKFDTATQEKTTFNWEGSGSEYHVVSIFLKNGKLYLVRSYYYSYSSYYTNAYITILSTNGAVTVDSVYLGYYYDVQPYDLPRIAADDAGNVYSSQPVKFSQNYTSKGSYMDTIGFNKFNQDMKALSFFGTMGEGEGQFLKPADISIDSQQNVYLLDSIREDIQMMTLEK